MNSRQKTGLIIFFIGMILFLGQEFPDLFRILRDYVTIPVILMFFGLLIILTNREQKKSTIIYEEKEVKKEDSPFEE